MSDSVVISKTTDTISVSVVSTGQVNTGQNIGDGAGVFKEKVGADFRYRTLTQGNGINITQNANTVEIGLDVTDNVTFNNLTVNGTVNSDLIPDGDETRNLGSAAAKWNELYLSGNTITLGTATISSSDGGIILPAGSTIDGETIATGAVTDTDDVPEGSTNLYYTSTRVNNAFDTRLATKTTTNLAEGTNLYHTTARARSAISVTDAGGDGSMAYNSSTGVITYTGPSATDVRAHFSAGTGITITNGAIASTITQFTTANARSAISATDVGGEGSFSYDSATGVMTYTGPSHSGLEVTSAKNQANGYAGLDSSGKVAAAQLPSYVDDVVEAANLAALPVSGETGKIYVTLDTNKTYRWSGSAYVEISASPGSTDAVTEGSTNLYFTTQRARDAFSASTGITITNGAIATTITQYTDASARSSISVTDAGGDGSLSYNSSTGVITYTGPSASETRAHFTAGTGISITNGSIASTITQYTDAGARAAVSVTDAGGDGSLAYNNTTGVITYTGPSASETRAHFSAGTGITITDGVIANTVTDTNTTYAISAVTGGPSGANLRLTAGGSGSGHDDVTFANGTNIAVTRTDANTITIGTTGLATVATSGAYSDLSGTPTIPTVPEDLNDLLDVNAPSPSDGDVLTWDGTAGEWTNSPAGGGGGGSFDQGLDTTDSVEFAGLTLTGGATTVGIDNRATQYSEIIVAGSSVNGGTGIELRYNKEVGALADGDSPTLIEFAVVADNDGDPQYGYTGKIQSTLGMDGNLNNIQFTIYDDGITTFDENQVLLLQYDSANFNNGTLKINYDSVNTTSKINSLANDLHLISDTSIEIHNLSIGEPWIFNGNGDLILPTGGDIKDSEGNSVLGSIFGDYNDDNTDYPTVEDSPSSYTHFLDIGTHNAYELNMNTSQFTLRLGNSTQTTYKAPRTVWLVLNDVYSGGTIDFSLNVDSSTALADTVTLRSGGSFPSTSSFTAGNGVTYIQLVSPDNKNWFFFSSDLT
jgi:hypothetical protein